MGRLSRRKPHAVDALGDVVASRGGVCLSLDEYCINGREVQARASACDSTRASSFVVVLQLRMVMFLYSGSEATLLSRLLVALAASREK
jgi:hypothetical protein